jgi:hypothetical protein
MFSASLSLGLDTPNTRLEEFEVSPSLTPILNNTAAASLLSLS